MELEVVDINHEINNLLIGMEVCWRCRLRFIHETIDFQQFNEQIISDETFCCYTCGGILQESFVSDSVIYKLRTDIVNSGFKFLSFQVVVSTPINLFIREFSVCVVLKEQFSIKYANHSMDNMIQIKSVWRFLIKDRLSESIEKEYINGNQVNYARLSKDCLIENDFLIVNVTFNHFRNDFECKVLSELEPELFQHRRKGESRYKWDLFTRKVADKVLKNTSKEKFQRYYGAPPGQNRSNKGDESPISMAVEISRQDPVMIAGRYCKLSRRLPQSPWIFDGVRKLESSVEELIAEKLISTFESSSNGFISSGREDVDVRMLGRGRPFVMELRNCKKMVRDVIDNTQELENVINAFCRELVVVKELKIISKEFVSLIKQGEEEKSKQYRMVVWCENGISAEGTELATINGTRDLLVQQLTPIRVLHRRALIDRPRTFYSFSATRLDRALSPDAIESDQSLGDYRRFLAEYDPDHLFLLRLRCQAGSYVKEFVHGDLGRTRPNLATVMQQQCDILALDVMEIELDWPPK